MYVHKQLAYVIIYSSYINILKEGHPDDICQQQRSEYIVYLAAIKAEAIN